MIHSGKPYLMESWINIKHTKPRSIKHADTRGEFIEDFVYLLRYIADGRANVGQLRRPGTLIHRPIMAPPVVGLIEIPRAPQKALDDEEFERWVAAESHLFGS